MPPFAFNPPDLLWLLSAKSKVAPEFFFQQDVFMHVLKIIILLLMYKDYITLFLNTRLPEGECFTPFFEFSLFLGIFCWRSDALYKGKGHA